MVVDEVTIRVKAEVDAAIAKMTQLQNVNKQNHQTGLDMAKSIAGYTNVYGLAVKGAEALIRGTAELIKESVSLAAGFESARLQWGVLLGDMGAGEKMFSKIQALAAKTPLSFESVESGARTLKQFGLATVDILPTIKMLGDVSMGNAEKLRGLSIVYGQIMSTGRLMGQDLLQLINQGFNPLQIISEKTGESMAELKKRMEKGGISAKEVADAFKVATSEGGLFYGMMDKTAESSAGLWSTAQDNINLKLAAFGEGLLKVINPALKEFNQEMDRVARIKTLTDVGEQGATAGVESLIDALALLKQAREDAMKTASGDAAGIEAQYQADLKVLNVELALARARESAAKQLADNNAERVAKALQKAKEYAEYLERIAFYESLGSTAFYSERTQGAIEYRAALAAEAKALAVMVLPQTVSASTAFEDMGLAEYEAAAATEKLRKQYIELQNAMGGGAANAPEDPTAKIRESINGIADGWNMAQGALGAYGDLVKNQGDAEIAAMKKRGATDEEIKKKQNEINQKAFEANKINKLAEIAINTAVETSKVLATPWMAALIVGLGAVQAGMVAAQNYVPMAEGGSGIVTKPTLFLAGEAGPEPYAFGGANNKLGMGGGVTQIFNIGGSVIAENQVKALGVRGMAEAGRGY